jgi:hypothetical protein
MLRCSEADAGYPVTHIALTGEDAGLLRRWHASDEAAFDQTWGWFELMRAFFRKSADEGRRTVFTADQLGACDTRDRSEKRSSHRTAPVPAPRSATPAAPGILRIAWQAWRS